MKFRKAGMGEFQSTEVNVDVELRTSKRLTVRSTISASTNAKRRAARKREIQSVCQNLSLDKKLRTTRVREIHCSEQSAVMLLSDFVHAAMQTHIM